MSGRGRAVAAALVGRALGSPPVTFLAERATSDRLPVLAFHGVDDGDAFSRVLDVIAERHHTVTAAHVAAWLGGRGELPERPVWITFDDGHPEVVSRALPLLQQRAMTATLFVCADLLDTNRPQWWDLARAAADLGLIAWADLGSIGTGSTPTHHVDAAEFMRRLKDAPDVERRSLVDTATARLADHGVRIARPQLTTADLHTWLAAGGEIGNHSWDHPCLDRCEPDEQRRQIRVAHDALCAATGGPIDVFAWPNGNPATAAAEELAGLDYRLVAGFDHRLCRRDADPHAVSRLRIDSDADPARVRSILSGAHPFVYHRLGRVRSTGMRSDAG